MDSDIILEQHMKQNGYILLPEDIEGNIIYNKWHYTTFFNISLIKFIFKMIYNNFKQLFKIKIKKNIKYIFKILLNIKLIVH